MTFKIKKSGSFSDASFVKRKSGGSFVDVSFVKVKKAGSWVDVWPLTPPVSITNASVISNDISGVGPATAEYQILNSGTVWTVASHGASGTPYETWLLSGAASDYEVRVTPASGDTPTGSALNTWLSLGTSHSWDYVQNTSGIKSGTITVEIRRVSDGVVLDTATITLYAEVG